MDRKDRNNQDYYGENRRSGRDGYYEDGSQGNRGGYYGDERQANRNGYYEDGSQMNRGGYYEDGRRGDRGGSYEDRSQMNRGGSYENGSQGNRDRYYEGNRSRYEEDRRRERGTGRDDRQRYRYDEERELKEEKKKKNKKRRKWLLVLEVLVLLIVAGSLFAAVQLRRMDHVGLKDIIVNSGIGQSGYRNIALFGVDSREGELESGTNSDTIMVCSINNKSGEIKLVSVYRDTYLDTGNGSYSKANSSYAVGGAAQAVNMLNKNLDLDIQDFVTVNFESIIEIVDLLGGIELEITEEERGWLNGYLVETSQVTGVPYTEVASAGTQTLTGIQAMAYCRIRYTEGWDYKRTERQRTVLEKIFSKAQSQGVTTLIAIANEMIPYISTSLSTTEIISLVTGMGRYSIGETQGFPFEKQAADISAGDVVVPVNLAQNVKELHAYLFGEADYTPSDTVQEISYNIIASTGIQ